MGRCHEDTSGWKNQYLSHSGMVNIFNIEIKKDFNNKYLINAPVHT